MKYRHRVILDADFQYVVTVCIGCGERHVQRTPVEPEDGETIKAVCPNDTGTAFQNVVDVIGGAEDVRDQFNLSPDATSLERGGGA